jgi:hypothetical protein
MSQPTGISGLKELREERGEVLKTEGGDKYAGGGGRRREEEGGGGRRGGGGGMREEGYQRPYMY